MQKNNLGKVSLIAALVAVPVAVLGYWLFPGGFVEGHFYTNRSDYLLAQGLRAVERGDQSDFLEAERVADLLRERHYDQALHLLNGKVYVEKAKVAARKQRSPEDYLRIQRAVQMVAAGAGLPWQPGVVRGPEWVTAGLVQSPVVVRSPLQEGCQKALAEAAQVQDDGDVGTRATMLAAECLFVLGNRQLAAQGMQAVAERNPNNMLAQHWLSRIYIGLNNPQLALQHLYEWGRLDVKNGVPYRWIGFFEKERPGKDHVTQAVEAYQEALRRGLSDAMKAEVVEELALIYRSQQDYPHALETVNQCPTRDHLDRKPEILTLKTQLLYEQGQADQALKLLDDLLKEDPGNFQALSLRGYYYTITGQPKRSIALLEKAVAIDPHDEATLRRLQQAYTMVAEDPATPAREKKVYRERAAEQDKAATAVSEVVQRLGEMQREAQQRPWDARIRYDIALKALTIGRYREARMWLEAALAVSPGNSKAATALGQLAAITGFAPRISQRSMQ